jgi:hypothetical protein
VYDTATQASWPRGVAIAGANVLFGTANAMEEETLSCLALSKTTPQTTPEPLFRVTDRGGFINDSA